MPAELDELEALLKPAAPAAGTPPTVAPSANPELDALTDAVHDQRNHLEEAVKDEKFDPVEFYRTNKTNEALDFASKVQQGKQTATPQSGVLGHVASFSKGIGEELGNTVEDIWKGAKSTVGQLPPGEAQPKSGLGSFVAGGVHGLTNIAALAADPIGLKERKAKIDAYDKLVQEDEIKRQQHLQETGSNKGWVSTIPPEAVVTPEERAKYDELAGARRENTAAYQLGPLQGAQLAIKGYRGLTEWDRHNWTADKWADRIRDDASLRDAAEELKKGNVDEGGLVGPLTGATHLEPAELERMKQEGTINPESIAGTASVADPSNLVLAEGLRLPIVGKAAGYGLRVSGSAAKAIGGVADKLISHGAGKGLAQVGGGVALYKVTESAIHGDMKPLGIAVALFAARSALRRGGGLVNDAGREILDEGFVSPSARAAADAAAGEAAAGTGPRSASGAALENFIDPGQNMAAASRVARRTVQGAAMGAVGGVPFAALADNPEDAGKAIGGGVAFGGALGPAGAVEGSLNRAMEINKAATVALAERGGAQRFNDAGLQKQNDAAMQDLPTGAQTYLNAMRGLVSGFKSRTGDTMKMAVLNQADYARHVSRLSGAAPEAAGTSHGFYDARTGTIYLNKGNLRLDSAGHETGHFITSEVMRQMGRAYGDALRNATESGLFNGDKPTPEFQRFIDDYNSKTPGTPIPSDRGKGSILTHPAVSEYLSETVRGILGEPNIGRYMLPKDVSDHVADKLVKMYGNESGAKEDIFSRTDLPTIHHALKDVIFDLGRGLRPDPARGRAEATAEPTAPESGSPATGTPETATSPNSQESAPNTGMAENHEDIGLTQDAIDAVRDYHINFPGMEPVAQRANARKGIGSKSKDKVAEERGAEWDEMFDKYAEYLRTNGLQAPSDPTELHQQVIWFHLASDPVPKVDLSGTPKAAPALAPAAAEATTSRNQPGALEPSAPARQEQGGVVTEQEISNRLADAEQQAGSNPAKRKEARINALLDVVGEGASEQGSLQRRKDAGGKERFTGTLDPDNNTAHRMLLDEMGVNRNGQAAIALLNNHVGQTVYLDYKSAPKTEPGDLSGKQRSEEYKASTPEERKAGGEHVEQQGKAFHILGFRVWPKSGGVTMFGFSPDKWISNAHKLIEHLKGEGMEPGYSDINDPSLPKDIQAYSDNHANGWKGDGSAPVEGREPTPGYTPTQIPENRFQLLNAALNFDISNKADSKRAGARENAMEAQYRALENEVPLDEETGDVNPLRALINKSGKLVSTNAEGKTRKGTGEHLESVYENISPDLVTGVSETNDGQNIVRPAGFEGNPGALAEKGIPRYDYASSGFMPGALEEGKFMPRGKDEEFENKLHSFMNEEGDAPPTKSQWLKWLSDKGVKPLEFDDKIVANGYLIDPDFEKITPVSDWLAEASSHEIEQVADELGIKRDFNKDFWDNPGTLFHATSDDNVTGIDAEGIGARNKTRGLTNRGVGPAVYTSSEFEELAGHGSYGDKIYEIDTDAMKRDGFTPEVSMEPEVEEAELAGAVAHKLGVENYEQYTSSDMSPTTVVIHGHIPAKYVKRANFMPNSGERGALEPEKDITSFKTKWKNEAEKAGSIYQGQSDQGLHTFKEESTGGNFSIKDGEVTPEKIQEKADEVRKSFGGEQVNEGNLDEWLKKNGFMPGEKGALSGKDKITETPEFKKWFGESQVVDKEGKPAVVFHGTNRDFTTFSPEEKSSKTGNPNAQLGYFFTDSPAEANRYTENWGKAGGRVIPAYLSLEKPYKMSYKEFDDMAMLAYRSMKADPNYDPAAETKFGDMEGQKKAAALVAKHDEVARQQVKARRDELIAEGYDGVTAKVGGVTEYIAFHPEQIKSATGNNGQFDKSNPDIRFMPDEKKGALEDKPEVDKLGFYSGLSRIIDKKIPNRASGEQILATLKGAGAKQEEIDTMGLQEFLKSHDGPVTKAELKDFVKAGGVQLREITKGDEAADARADRAYQLVELRDTLENRKRRGYDDLAEPEDRAKMKELEEEFAGMTDNQLKNTKHEGNTKFEKWKLPGGPLSRDTEILTRNGWKRMDAVKIGDIVLTRKDEDGALEWNPVQDTPSVFSEKMYHFKNQSVDLLVTPFHQMVAKKRRRGSPDIFRTTAEKLWLMGECVIPLTGKWKGGSNGLLFGLDAGDVAEFMGWFIAEGHCVTDRNGKKSTIQIAQCKLVNREKCERIEALLTRLGFRWKNYSYASYGISCKSVPAGLLELIYAQGKAREKFIPSVFFGKSRSIINRMLESMIMGDGSIKKSPGRLDRSSVYTLSERLAGDIQAAALMTGKRATVRQRPTGLFCIAICEKEWASVDDAKSGIVDYNDTAFCVTVENHAIYVRRNGTASFTGNSNYKEVLLTLPTRSEGLPSGYRVKETGDGGRYGWAIFDADGLQVGGTVSATREGALENAGKVKEASELKPADFHSSHWDEPNVLAHIRQQDMKDAEGSKVRLIEEIQSDWHQKGRKEGYAGQPVTVYDAIINGMPAGTGYKTAEQAQSLIDSMKSRAKESGIDTSKATYEVKPRETKTTTQDNFGNSVQDAPFKKSWQELAFKRALKMAVDDGMDKIAWTKGAEQAKRYEDEFRKGVDSIKWRDVGDAHKIEAVKDGQVVFSDEFNQKGLSHQAWKGERRDLAEVVGKDIANQILSGEGHAKDVNEAEWKGNDLTIGGEGMKGFYDKILPSFVNKYVKQWGGKVETSEVITDKASAGYNNFRGSVIDLTDGTFGVRDDEGRPIGPEFPTREEAENYIKGTNGDIAQKTATVHSVTITPAMREAISQGQPLFMPGSGKSKDAVSGRSVSDSEMLRDGGVSKSSFPHGSSSTNVESRRVVVDSVIDRASNLKVLDSIISLLPVDVVDNLGGKELATKMFLHDRAMLKDVLSVSPDADIAIPVDVARSIVQVIAKAAAKVTGATSDFKGGLKEGRSAMGASNGNVHAGESALSGEMSMFMPGEKGGKEGALEGEKDSLRLKRSNPKGALEEGIDVYHGTPHKIKGDFDLNKIGTGEGSQAYGHGLYFAENKDVAISYWPRESGMEDKLIKEYNAASAREDYDAMELWEAAMLHELPDKLRKDEEVFGHIAEAKRNKIADKLQAILDAAKGGVYKVRLTAKPEEFLDYDAPLKEQTPELKAKLEEMLKKNGWNAFLDAIKEKDKGENKRALQDAGYGLFDYPDSVGGIYHTIEQEEGKLKTAQMFTEAGIPGFKFWDEGSRGEKKGTRNFVLFDTSKAKVIGRNGKLSDPAPGDSFMPEAYHGTPHEFDKFSLSKLGTGEGAQAFGWGLYFAENKKVADEYRKRLTSVGSTGEYEWNGETYRQDSRKDPVKHAVSLVYHDGKPTAARIAREIIRDAKAGEAYAKEMGGEEYGQKMLDTVNQIRSKAEIKYKQGQTYHVDLDVADNELLQNDKPLAEQPEEVKKVIRDLLKREKFLRANDEGPRQLTSAWKNWLMQNGGMSSADNGQSVYEALSKDKGSDEKASKYLDSIGIKGIKYADEGSRKKRVGRTYNYVIFDDSRVTVMSRNGKPVSLKDVAPGDAKAESKGALEN